MRNVYPENCIVIQKVENGYIVKSKGTIEDQQDNIDQIHVFETIQKLNDFIRNKYHA